jgi:hypothetical protein
MGTILTIYLEEQKALPDLAWQGFLFEICGETKNRFIGNR